MRPGAFVWHPRSSQCIEIGAASFVRALITLCPSVRPTASFFLFSPARPATYEECKTRNANPTDEAGRIPMGGRTADGD